MRLDRSRGVGDSARRAFFCTSVLILLPCVACKPAHERAAEKLAQARDALLKDRVDQAEALLQSAFELRPMDCDIQETLAQLLVEQGRAQEARQVLDPGCRYRYYPDIEQRAAQRVLDALLARGQHAEHAREIIDLAGEAGGFRGCGLLKAIQLAESEPSQARGLLSEVRWNMQYISDAVPMDDFVARVQAFGAEAVDSETCEELRERYNRVPPLSVFGFDPGSLERLWHLKHEREGAFVYGFLRARLGKAAQK